MCSTSAVTMFVGEQLDILPCRDVVHLPVAVTSNVNHTYIRTYIHVVCCVGDFKGKAVHTFVMCAHFPDVRTLHSMLHCG